MADIGANIRTWADRNLPFVGSGWAEKEAYERELQRLQRQSALKKLQAASATPPTAAEKLRQQLEAVRSLGEIDLDQMARRGEVLANIRARSKEQDTSSTKNLKTAEADQALRLVQPILDQELAMRMRDDQRFQDALSESRQQRADALQLQRQQIASNQTMGLLSSILGAGVAAAALFG